MLRLCKVDRGVGWVGGGHWGTEGSVVLCLLGDQKDWESGVLGKGWFGVWLSFCNFVPKERLENRGRKEERRIQFL